MIQIICDDPAYETVAYPAVAFEDARGKIVNVIQGDEIRHVAVITRKAGSVFGNHWHPDGNTQRMYLVSGRYRSVSVPVDADGRPTADPLDVVVCAGALTTVGPRIGHAYEALEDCVFLNLNTSTREVDGFGTHTIRLHEPLIR